MSVTVVGGVLLGLALLALVLRPGLFPWVLSASAAFPATAAVTARGNSVPPFFVLALLTVPLLLVGAGGMGSRGSRRQRVRIPPVVVALGLFAVVALVVTALAPWWFAGQPILLPRGGIDAEVVRRTPLAYTASMAAQAGYLVLGLSAAVYLGRSAVTGRLPEGAFVTGIGLCSLQWLVERSGHRFPTEQFQNYANVQFNQYELRFHGIFPEPSYLAVFAAAAAAYYGFRLLAARGRALVLPAVMLALSLGNLVLSASGTAALTVVVVAVLLYVAAFVPYLTRRRRLTPSSVGLLVLLVALPVLLATFAAPLARSLRDVIEAKAGSESAGHRFAADRFSLRILADTHGLGVGLGANRPSSFLTMLLSCTGVLGTVLLLVALVLLLVPTLRPGPRRAAAWSLVVLLVAKSIGEPSSSAPLLWLLVGVLLTTAYVRPRPAPSRAPGRPASRRHRALV